MGLRVVIFEDCKELADAMKEYMEGEGFDVQNVYSLASDSWMDADVVLGDFRNQIVSFEEVRKACVKHSIPLLAISGAETSYRPQLLKPFSLPELQAAILEAMKAVSKKRSKKDERSFFQRLIHKIAG